MHAAVAARDLFGRAGQAAAYALFRPTYPTALLQRLAEFIPADIGRSKAVDVACGTGQLTATLARPSAQGGLGFDRVVGIDSSAAQLSKAQAVDNVHYEQGDAYKLPLDSSSAQLVTMAQALHWLDAHKYAEEACRVLVPRGVLAVAGYGVLRVVDNDQAEQLFKSFYYDVLGSRLKPGDAGCYWDCDRTYLDAGLAGVEKQLSPPLDNTSLVRDWFYDRRQLSFEALIGYIRSMSAYQTYRQRHPHPQEDPLETFAQRLQPIMAAQKRQDQQQHDQQHQHQQQQLTVEFPFFLIMGRKP
eukprot:m.194112 g.194112  ORF g.194112 m.194112 type:complete len:300 (+) comp17613_c0_seq1:708-1607(+)